MTLIFCKYTKNFPFAPKRSAAHTSIEVRAAGVEGACEHHITGPKSLFKILFIKGTARANNTTTANKMNAK
jgi:hypothetical protein